MEYLFLNLNLNSLTFQKITALFSQTRYISSAHGHVGPVGTVLSSTNLEQWLPLQCTLRVELSSQLNLDYNPDWQTYYLCDFG